ncbi:testis-expressed protein 10 isoform X1 [Eublepharis macularius]|uniref:Testis-expressed protein 10 isoform X1 n=1 Tax=Eublepharis macularius TaxID=481883 RepID=A0AA97K2D1_EUBMA|nr:testis-expressed protein 10 isoform X1 [Eublepharis macularius]
MTKKRKHQEDFHKVKLKVGRKKPRLENATDTNFKTKAIHIPEQLREDPILPTNNRKLNIKDLLSQMNHYSAGVKQSALLGLKDLLSQYPFVIDAHLSNILSELAAVFTDRDATVRAAAIRLLQFLAPKIRAEHLSPFFPLVSAHLSSAMTHISEGIQEDSLKVLDILLEEHPTLLMDRSSVLLNNFVELISHQQLSKRVKNRENVSWMLSVSPNRRITSQQWRLNVLLRLRKFLHVLVEGSSELDDDELQGENSSPQMPKNTLSVNWQDLAKGQEHIQLCENGGLQSRINTSFRLRSLVSVTGGAEKSLSSPENLKRFIEIIIPLLLDCWIEASPTKVVAPVLGNLLEPGSQQLMEQVLSIIYLLWKLAKQNEEPQQMEVWLRANYLTDFKHHFMCHFPYSFQETIKHRRKDSLKSNKCYMTSSNNIDHLLLNLTLCDIMVSLASSSTLQMDSHWLDMIRKFVIETLEDGYKLNSKQLNRLLRVTWRLWQIQISKVTSETLMKAVYTLYQQRNLPFSVRTLLLKFFSRVYQKEELNTQTNRSRSKVLTRWLAGLPQQLVLLGLRNPELSEQLIGTIYSAASRANKGMLQSLQAAAPRIYDPLDGAVALLPAESQQRLVQLVYFLPHLPGNLLSSLSRCCIMGKLSVKLSGTLIGILRMRSSFVGGKYPVQSSMTDVDYFSFLFSTLTGFSKEELTSLQSIRGRPHISQTQLSPVHLYLTDLDQFLYHWAVIEMVNQCLSAIPSRSQCIDIVQSGICKYLAGLTVIPDSTAGSVLCAISKLLDQACLLNENLAKFLASLCCSLLYLILTIEREDEEHLQKRDVLWAACISLLTALPRVLRLMLQSLQVSRVRREELPVLAQLLRLLMQHGQLRSHMVTNEFLVKQIVKDIVASKSGEAPEQWLTDLHYYFNVGLASHPQVAGAVNTVY